MPVRTVGSKQNSKLKELRRALAQPGRNAAGVVGLEGPHLVAEAVRAGLKIECVFAAEGEERLLEAIALPEETDVLLAPREVLAAALTTESPQMVAALVEPRAWTWDDVLGAGNGAALVVVLAGLQDPGNMGTILRSAEAFGATGVVSLPGTVNEWNPKGVRASAGSVLRMPLVHEDAHAALTKLRRAGATVLTTAVDGGHDVSAHDLKGSVALILGNEGAGVPAEIASEADGAVTIPCPGPVESLNAAVAASVLLYEVARQRGAKR